MADDTPRDPRWTDETLALAASLVSTGTDVTPMRQWGLADAPRRWELPPEPGPEVTAVRDRGGRLCDCSEAFCAGFDNCRDEASDG